MAYTHYTVPHTPWCIIGKESWGVAVACKVPESRAQEFCTRYGFTVLIRDSDFPVAIDEDGTMPECIPAQSNPRRHGEEDKD